MNSWAVTIETHEQLIRLKFLGKYVHYKFGIFQSSLEWVPFGGDYKSNVWISKLVLSQFRVASMSPSEFGSVTLRLSLHAAVPWQQSYLFYFLSFRSLFWFISTLLVGNSPKRASSVKGSAKRDFTGGEGSISGKPNSFAPLRKANGCSGTTIFRPQ